MSTATIDNSEQVERNVPASAARFEAEGTFQFAAAEEGASGRAVRLHARDAKPIQHWYWGKIAHDMSGVIHKDRLAIDWCHDSEQILGYVDQVSADQERGLDLAGAILTDIDEKAAEVAAKGDAGVPYESSIDWRGPAVLEYVDSGMTAEVNGYTFDGPGYIARQWHLRGVAICPHGADLSATTEFSAGGEVGVRVFTQSKKGVVMPTSQQPSSAGNAPANATDQATQQTQASGGTATPENATVDAGTQNAAAGADPTPANSAAPAAADADRATLGKRFTDAFGEDLGAKLFAKGLSFSDATVEHAKQLGADLAKLREENDQLKQQVQMLRGQMGESDPASFTPEGAPAKDQAENSGADDNAHKFAAAIKLPKAE